MQPMDLLSPMAAILTVTTFLVGFAEIRSRAYLDEVPKQFAVAIFDNPDPVRSQSDWERLEPEARRRERLLIAILLFLFGANVALVVTGWRLEASSASERRVLMLVAACQGLVLLLGLLDRRWIASRRERVLRGSAGTPFLESLHVSMADKDKRYGLQRTVQLREVAVQRIPDGVATRSARQHLNQARLDLAEHLLSERRPELSLAQLRLIDESGTTSGGFLREGGAHDAADMIEGFGMMAVADALARTFRMLGDPDQEFHTRLRLLRSLPNESHDWDALVDSALRSGCSHELARAVVALRTDASDRWGEPIVEAIHVSLISRSHNRRGETSRENLDLEELRLYVGVGAPTGGEWAVLELAERLLTSIESMDKNDDARRALLKEVDSALGPQQPDATSQWLLLRGRLCRLRGDTLDAFSLLLDALQASESYASFPAAELVQMAHAAESLDKLNAVIAELSSGDVLARMFLVRMADALEPLDGERAAQWRAAAGAIGWV